MAIVINGSGTVTGLSVGGLPDNVIDNGTMADDAIGLAEMASGTDGNIISYDASGNPVAIATGSDGQVLTSTGAGSPPAFEALPASGKVLQVVSETAKDYAGTSSASFVDTGAEATITPSSTSSKILVSFDSGLCYQTSAVNYYAIFTLDRAGTNIGNGNGGFTGDYWHTNADWNDKGFNVSFSKLDSPSTTSATTYKVQFKTDGGTIYYNLEGYGTITLMEIAG